MLTWRYLYIVLTHLIKGEMSFQLNKEDNMSRKCMALTGVEAQICCCPSCTTGGVLSQPANTLLNLFFKFFFYYDTTASGENTRPFISFLCPQPFICSIQYGMHYLLLWKLTCLCVTNKREPLVCPCTIL